MFIGTKFRDKNSLYFYLSIWFQFHSLSFLGAVLTSSLSKTADEKDRQGNWMLLAYGAGFLTPYDFYCDLLAEMRQSYGCFHIWDFYLFKIILSFL